jgi:hypothetical protein
MAISVSAKGRSRAKKIVPALIALAGVVSIPAVQHGLSLVGREMGHNAVPSVLIVGGVLLGLYAFRDELLRLVGWMSPTRVERLVKTWLESQNYGIQKTPPGVMKWTLVATDAQDRKCVIGWTTEPVPSLGFLVSWGIGEGLDIWKTATPADLREFRLRAIEAGVRLVESGGWSIQDLDDPAKAQIIYTAEIPRDRLNYNEFFGTLNSVIGAQVVARNLTSNLLEELAERQQATLPPAAQPGATP